MDKASLFFHRSWPRSVAGIQEILESNHLLVKTRSCYFWGSQLHLFSAIWNTTSIMCPLKLISGTWWTFHAMRNQCTWSCKKSNQKTLSHFYVEEKHTKHTKIHVVCTWILSIENHATQRFWTWTFTNSYPASQLCRCASHGRRVPQAVPRERGRRVAKIDRCTWFMRSRTWYRCGLTYLMIHQKIMTSCYLWYMRLHISSYHWTVILEVGHILKL